MLDMLTCEHIQNIYVSITKIILYTISDNACMPFLYMLGPPKHVSHHNVSQYGPVYIRPLECKCSSKIISEQTHSLGKAKLLERIKPCK